MDNEKEDNQRENSIRWRKNEKVNFGRAPAAKSFSHKNPVVWRMHINAVCGAIWEAISVLSPPATMIYGEFSPERVFWLQLGLWGVFIAIN